MNFGEELKRIRESKGMTVNQLSVYSGVSAASISRYETGDRGTPKPATIEKLAKGLKVDYKELMKVAGYVENKNDEYLPQKNQVYVLKEFVDKYNIDLNEPGAKEKLEKIIQLVFGDMNEK